MSGFVCIAAASKHYGKDRLLGHIWMVMEFLEVHFETWKSSFSPGLALVLAHYLVLYV